MNRVLPAVVIVVLLIVASAYLFVEQEEPLESIAQEQILPVEGETSERRSSPRSAKITEMAVLDLVNEARSEIKRPALTIHPALVQVAASRAFDMKDREYFSEVSPLGESVRTVASQAAYRHLHLAEYRLKGKFSNISELAEKILDLENPETQLLLAGYTETGIGIEKASDGSGELYLIQVLAVPLAACTAVDSVLTDELAKNRELLEQLGVDVEEALDVEFEREPSSEPDVEELIAVTRLLNENVSTAIDTYEGCIRKYLESVSAKMPELEKEAESVVGEK